MKSYALRKLQNFLEKNVSTRNHDESVLKQSSVWATSITWGLIATSGLSIAWLSLAQTEEIVSAQGKLVPIGSVKEIQMPLGGIVEEILVKDGDKVDEDEILIKLDTEATQERLNSLEKNLILKEEQLNLKELELIRYNNMVNDSINTLSAKIDHERQILEKYKILYEVGAGAELQYLQQRNTLEDVKGRLREAKLDRMRQSAIIKQDIKRIETDISSIKSDLADIKVTLRYQVLRSPVEGVVFDLQPKGRGYTGQTSETLMKVVPFNALEAKVEIPSSDIGFVRNNMEAEISIDSFPATDFGVLKGEVSQVGSDALAPDPAKRQLEYRYPATIKLNSQTLELNNGKKLSLQPGMSLIANIKLRKVSYIQLLLGSFRDKTESLKQL